MGIESFLDHAKKTVKLDSENIFNRLEVCFNACMMHARKMFLSCKINHENLKNIIEPLVNFLSSFCKITLQKH